MKERCLNEFVEASAYGESTRQDSGPYERPSCNSGKTDERLSVLQHC